MGESDVRRSYGPSQHCISTTTVDLAKCSFLATVKKNTREVPTLDTCTSTLYSFSTSLQSQEVALCATESSVHQAASCLTSPWRQPRGREPLHQPWGMQILTTGKWSRNQSLQYFLPCFFSTPRSTQVYDALGNSLLHNCFSTFLAKKTSLYRGFELQQDFNYKLPL